MNIQIIRISLFFAAFFLLNQPEGTAQNTGTLTGKVIDKGTGQPISGAAVKITALARGIATDADGKYRLPDIKAGIYQVDFFYIGYSTKHITEVQINPGQSTTLDVVLEETGQQLAAVIITATARQESVNALYAKQKNSASISDGISSESIKKSPDKNASEVVKRISGATIQENKFVVVRGLSDRYNQASLDGLALPSTEPNRKAFSFNIVPSNLIDNIIVSKTATPDLAADFAGGSIQMVTKDIPDRNFIDFSAGYGYNTVTTFKDFRSGYRNTSDYFGFDGGSRSLSSNFPTTSKVISLGGNQTTTLIKSLNNNFGIYTRPAFLSQNYQFTLGRVREIGPAKNNFGATFSVSYRNSESKDPDVIRQYNGYNFVDNQYRFSANLGAVANFAYAFGRSKLMFKNIYNRIFDDVFTYRTGSNSANSSFDSKFYAYDLTQKSLLKSALEGVHKLGEGKTSINWNAGISNIINQQPDQRKVNYLQNSPGEPFVASVTTLGKENTRFFSNLNELIYSANASVSMPLEIMKSSGTLKMGVSAQLRERDFEARFIGLVINTNKDGYNDVRTRPVEYLFSPNVVNNGYFNLQEIPNLNDQYSANSHTFAGFAMMDSKVTPKLRLIYGVRAEQFELNLKTANPAATNKAALSNLDILPSLNATYSITDKANLRGAYYRTLARPEFREVAPFAYYDYENFASVLGNPNLKRTSVNNVDIRYEYYPKAGQILSVSAFYKHFSNAIEPNIEDQNSTPTLSYFNAKAAKVVGIEMEARRKLEFINDSEFFNNTTAYFNLSLTHSEIKNQNPNALVTYRPLVGQSPYVINAGIQHSMMKDNVSLNILYNRIGRRIHLVGGTRFPDIYENPRDLLDAQLSFKVMRKRAEIKLNASDLLNQKNLYYFDYDQSGNFSNADEILRKYKQGTTFSIGLSYKIQ